MKGKVEISRESKVVAVKDHLSADLAGERAILQVKTGIYFGLDKIGSRVWEEIQKPVTVDRICNLLAAEYDVTPEQCTRDVLSLLERMETEKLIEITE